MPDLDIPKDERTVGVCFWMLEMRRDRLDRLLAGRAKKSEISIGDVQMESTNKSPQLIGNIRPNQALRYRQVLRQGRNFL
jgi:hypothetical protein